MHKISSSIHKIKKYYSRYGDTDDNNKNKDLNKNLIQCKLCPHECIIGRGKCGICGTRKNIDGKFYTLVYGKPCAIHIDPIEKKPLYHFYPGKKIFSLGTLGCNLRCKGCQNYDISQIKAEKRIELMETYTPKDIISGMKDSGCEMIAYTYNEPTIFFEYMMDIAKIAKSKGYKNVIVSNGYTNPEPLKEMLRYIHAANIDLKGFDKQFYKEYTGAKMDNILETIETINNSKTWLELTNLIIPSLNDDMKKIRKMCAWISSLKNGRNIPLHFSRFYPYYQAQELSVTPEDILYKAKSVALSKGLKYVYIGNLGMMENTYCECGNLLIERGYNMYYTNTPGIIRGKCTKCKKTIDGKFD